MTARVMSMSMVSDTQFIIIGVAVLAAAWYVKTKVSAVADTASDVIFGPKMEARVTMRPAAKISADEYIKMGYAIRDKNGVFKITALGQMYIDRMAKQEGIK